MAGVLDDFDDSFEVYWPDVHSKPFSHGWSAGLTMVSLWLLEGRPRTMVSMWIITNGVELTTCVRACLLWLTWDSSLPSLITFSTRPSEDGREFLTPHARCLVLLLYI